MGYSDCVYTTNCVLKEFKDEAKFPVEPRALVKLALLSLDAESLVLPSSAVVQDRSSEGAC